MSKKIIDGYQIESRDGLHFIPDDLHSFEVFLLAGEAADWIQHNTEDPENWIIVPVFEGDVEQPTYI